MKRGKALQISIIIPVLDEESVIEGLFETLARQIGVTFEIILSDGGSSDFTCRKAEELGDRFAIPLKTVSSGRGRGLQLNAGSSAAEGDFFLFLHADSRFEESCALKKGVDLLKESSRDNTAAKFSLRFQRVSKSPSLAYYYYESKAGLLRPECTHGDQGLMMHREAFEKFGPFDEFPPMLAETGFAERVRRSGQLRLIPAVIITSARRFEAEGVLERQTLNAILMNCAAQGWYQPFTAAQDLYRNQGDTSRLKIGPILKSLHRLIQDLPPKDRKQFWRSTGRYVRQNAWQIPFFLDIRRNFNAGLPPGQGSTRFLKRYDRFAHPLLGFSLFDRAAAALTYCGFSLARLYFRK